MSEQPKCYLCDKTVKNADDSLCHGCNQYFCGDCDESLNVPFGNHDPFDHSPENDE